MRVNLHLYSCEAGQTSEEAVPLEGDEKWIKENFRLWRSVRLSFNGKIDYFEVLDFGVDDDKEVHYVIGKTAEVKAVGVYGLIQ